MSMLKRGVLYVFVLFLLSTPSKVEAATVGDQLTSPETSWQRSDHKDSHIIYQGKWDDRSDSQHYKGSINCSTSLTSIKFKFYGTKFRIISDKNFNHSNNISIKVDGSEHFYSTVSESHPYQVIVYEENNLDLGFHTVVISNLKDGYYMNLDAIDIDDTGYLIDYKSLLLTASAGNSIVKLNWNAIDNAASYSVERSATAGGPYTTIASDLTETSYTDKSVTANTTYYYIVKAKLNDTETVTSSEVSGTPTTETPTVDSKLKVVLEPEEKLQLSVDDHLDKNANMAWTSSDTTIAQVDASGVVTAIKAGNAVIHVQSPDGNYSEDINILVVDNADDYRLAVDLKVGKTTRLTVDDLTNTFNVTWDSSDATVATVSSKGVVTAKGKGLTLAKATDRDGNVVGQVYVRVRE